MDYPVSEWHCAVHPLGLADGWVAPKGGDDWKTVLQLGLGLSLPVVGHWDGGSGCTFMQRSDLAQWAVLQTAGEAK